MKERSGMGLRIWREYPKLERAVSNRLLPEHLILISEEWQPDQLQNLLGSLSQIPIQRITIHGVSNDVLTMAGEGVRKSGYNHQIRLKGNYSEDLRESLQEGTKWNSGQVITLADHMQVFSARQPSGHDLVQPSRHDLVLCSGRPYLDLGSLDPMIKKVKKIDFPKAVKAIVKFSKSDRPAWKDLSKKRKKGGFDSIVVFDNF